MKMLGKKTRISPDIPCSDDVRVVVGNRDGQLWYHNSSAYATLCIPAFYDSARASERLQQCSFVEAGTRSKPAAYERKPGLD